MLYWLTYTIRLKRLIVWYILSKVHDRPVDVGLQYFADTEPQERMLEEGLGVQTHVSEWSRTLRHGSC